MATPRRQPEKPHAPVWGAAITYVGCWSFAAAILAKAPPGDKVWIVVAGLVFIFPLRPFSPIDLIRAWKGQ